MQCSCVPRGSTVFILSLKNTFWKCHQTLKQIATGSPLGAANCISLLQGAASLKWLGNTALIHRRRQGGMALGSIPRHFVLWEVVSQTKYCHSPKFKHFGVSQFFSSPKFWAGYPTAKLFCGWICRGVNMFLFRRRQATFDSYVQVSRRRYRSRWGFSEARLKTCFNVLASVDLV